VESGQVEVTKKATLSLATKDTPLKSASTLSLRDMARQDPEILEFFRIVHEHDLREKALEAIESKLSRRD